MWALRLARSTRLFLHRRCSTYRLQFGGKSFARGFQQWLRELPLHFNLCSRWCRLPFCLTHWVAFGLYRFWCRFSFVFFRFKRFLWRIRGCCLWFHQFHSETSSWAYHFSKHKYLSWFRWFEAIHRDLSMREALLFNYLRLYTKLPLQISIFYSHSFSIYYKLIFIF